MALSKTQEELLSSDFYIIEAPFSVSKKYYLGEISNQIDGLEYKSGVFRTYDLKEIQVLRSPQYCISYEELLVLLGNVKTESFIHFHLNDEHEKAYSKRFDAFQKVKDLEKAVLYTQAQTCVKNFTTKDEYLSLLKTGLKNKRSGYIFGFYNASQKKAVLGLTPEFIYKKNNQGEFVTTAVAGTQLIDEYKKKGWSEKLKLEHKFVMKGISESLNGAVKWSKPYTFEYENLCHLKADGVIDLNMSKTNLSEKLHPTPAVGVLPKKHAFHDLGPSDRGYFGGYVELNFESAHFSLVCLRHFEWSKNSVQVCIGGGVVCDSAFDEEWSELEKKLKTFKKVWGIDHV